jgi:uncharacterized membrane protein YgcG
MHLFCHAPVRHAHLLVRMCCALVAASLCASPARADSTVADETGLMNQNAIAQIDNRNGLLDSNTGTMVGVFVEHGTAGETGVDAAVAAQKLLGTNFSALVWVATDTRQTDIVFSQPALKWLSADQEAALRQQLQQTLLFCCPSDSLPAVVDAVATALENGAKQPVVPRNYIRDDLGLLDDTHVTTIAAREQQLESATGKGIGIILMDEQPGKSPGPLALEESQSLDVNGAIAAVVWVARSGGTLTFSLETSPAFPDAIPDSTVSNINAAFQADMQSGQLDDAIAAAVDRTAAALEASSTPMPASPGGSASPAAAQGSGAPEARQTAAPATPPPAAGTSRASTALLILIGLAIVILIVTMAVRRRNAR